MFRWVSIAVFSISAPLLFWVLYQGKNLQEDNDQLVGSAPTDGADGWKRVLAHALVGNSVGTNSCPPDFLSCLMNKSYAVRCPSACENINALSKLLEQGDDDAVAAWLTKRLEELAMDATRPGLTAMLAGHTHVKGCPACPHVNCCLPYEGTVAEALLMRVGIFATHDEPTADMFKELADQQLRSLLPLTKANPEGYYNSTIKYYSTGRVDLGWVNEFLGTIQTFSARSGAGIHAYRRVPMLADGKLDFDFSTAQLPTPPGRPLVVGVLADWGCGNDASRRVIEELAKQQPDIVLHLGDTYYSGTEDEQKDLFLGLARQVLGKDVPIMCTPGNHDYYSSGSGFMWLIDELAKTQVPKQNASFVALRGDAWQILMLDTGILDSFQLNQIASALPLGDSWHKANAQTLPFLPDDQLEWALKQIEVGKAQGLKTIIMTHHQLFSRHEGLGVPNAATRELAFGFDLQAGVYDTSQWKKTSSDLPGKLPPDVQPAANTRLLDQFPAEVLRDVSAWFWGHEHASSVFAPYAGLQKGRLIGNACIPVPKPPLVDTYAANKDTYGTPWGGHPQVVETSTIGHGGNFLNLGFTTITLNGTRAHARYFEMEDFMDGYVTNWKDAVIFYEEDL